MTEYWVADIRTLEARHAPSLRFPERNALRTLETTQPETPLVCSANAPYRKRVLVSCPHCAETLPHEGEMLEKGLARRGQTTPPRQSPTHSTSLWPFSARRNLADAHGRSGDAGPGPL